MQELITELQKYPPETRVELAEEGSVELTDRAIHLVEYSTGSILGLGWGVHET